MNFRRVLFGMGGCLVPVGTRFFFEIEPHSAVQNRNSQLTCMPNKNPDFEERREKQRRETRSGLRERREWVKFTPLKGVKETLCAEHLYAHMGVRRFGLRPPTPP